MKFLIDHKKESLVIDNLSFTITCIVRNEINGWRWKKQVIRSIPKNYPVYPRQFPKGSWKITGIEYTSDPIFAPVKIKTNAFQMLPIWTLDANGLYNRKTEELTRDEAYWMHYSEGSNTTLGCIRLASSSDALKIASLVLEELRNEDFIPLEVI